jgi:predicted dehydrogenase
MANSVHYPSLASYDDVEISAICDFDVGRLNETADKYGVKGRYTEYHKMIEEVAPDGVYAIGPPHLMYDVWVWCLRQGLNLFIEKPLGITLHQARVLASLADDHGCVTQVGYQRRSAPIAVALREECLKHGPIVHACYRMYKHERAPLATAVDHMMGDSVHAIDTLRWMCGGEVVGIESATKCVGVPDINFIAALLHFDTGATGIMVNSWSSGRRAWTAEMHAPGIWVDGEFERGARLYAAGDVAGVEYDAQTVAGSDQNFIVYGHQAKTREFLDGIRSRSQPSSCFADAAKTTEVAHRILASSLLSE